MFSRTHAQLSRRTLLASFGVLTGAAALAACGGDGSSTSSAAGGSGKPKKGGTLAVGMPKVSDYINPLVATTSSLAWVTEPVVETLYAYDDDLKSVPLLAAADPEISKDGLTWTITLADGITFSNGDALTAEHVAAVVEHVSNPEAFTDWTSYFAYFVTGAKAKDDKTVVISLSTPYGILLSHLTNLPIVHKDYLDKTDETIGTGPYVVGKVTQGQSVVLNRNDAYHGEKSAPDAIEFRTIPDAATRLVELRSGKIHVMTDVPAANVEVLEGDKNVTMHVEDAPTSIMTFFNAKQAPFDDLLVRQALAYAMDRAGVRELVYRDSADIGQGPAGPSMEGFNEDALYDEKPDVAKAKALLKEAGLDSVDFTLLISTSSEATVKMAEVLVASWKDAGINCTLDPVDAGTWAARWVKGDYQMSMTTFVTGISAGVTAFPLFTSYGSQNPLNFGYANTKVDDLMNQAWATTDAAERGDLSRQVDALLAADAIAVPPVYPKFLVAQRNDITDLDQRDLGLGRLRLESAALVG